MTARVVAALWVIVGVALWNGVFDVYVSRGTHQYLRLAAEHELGRQPPPSMSAMMGQAKHDGAVAASFWAGSVVLAGWATLAVRLRRPH